MKAAACIIMSPVRGRATAICNVVAGAVTLRSGIRATAEVTEDVGIARYLRVTPEEPQWLVWLVPQVGIDYNIEASKNLKWNIH